MPITTLDALKKSATTYAKDLLMMPATGARATLQHMSAFPGLRGDHVFGQLEGTAELGPYKNTRKSQGNFKITTRTLSPKLGNCSIDFDPNEVYGTIYSSLVLQGDGLKNTDIAKNILFYVAGVLGKKLNMAIFSGKRSDSGDTTAELFDGFDTITEAEKTATNISDEKGNYTALRTITEANAIEEFQKLFDACDDELKGQHCKIFCTHADYQAYCRNYQLLHGSLPYNQEFKKTFLEGSDNLFEFVPLASKKGSKFIHIAPQTNMCYGYGAGEMPGELLSVEKYTSWMLTLEAAMAFGVEFRTLSPEMLMVGEIGADA